MNTTKSIDLFILTHPGDEYSHWQSRFTCLFNYYREELYNTAFRLTKSKPNAEDAVHDVFLKLWVKRSELQSISRLRSYLHVMIRNRVFDNMKKNKLEYAVVKKLYDEYTHCDVHKEQLTAKQYAETLHNAVKRMPAKQQQVYRLVKELGLSYKATAFTLQISDLTVKKHISNAMRFIQDHFDKSGILPY